MSNSFYITTPIYYVNDIPHIGHAYTTLLADVLARYHRLLGDDTWFLTGTDEHGQKVQDAAKQRGIPEQEHVDETVRRFKDLWKKLEITNNDFIRTTEGRHTVIVQEILQDLFDRDEIYKANYDGWYDVKSETYITEKDLPENHEELAHIKRIEESNYFFRMGKYRDWLVDYIEQHPEFIQPDFRRNETLGFLRQELGDLCISRPKSRLTWGIELPFDAEYVTYVWFDALVNYISAIGYRRDDAQFEKWWPANYHLIGKDILTTHTVYWPTMLKAMGVPMPKTIFAHGWWLSGKDKMSKSDGNAINPMEYTDTFGVDACRYYLMAEMTLGQDASFTHEQFVQRYNSDLANDLGNLTSRVLKMIQANCDGKIPAPPADPLGGEEEAVLWAATQKAVDVMQETLVGMRLDLGIAEALAAVRACNRYLEQRAPWKQAKEDDKTPLYLTMYTSAEVLRVVSALLYPVMPEKMGALRKGLGLETTEPDVAKLRTWGVLTSGMAIADPGRLFPRHVEEEAPAESAAKKESAPEGVVDANAIDYEDFVKVKLRTAEITSAEAIEGSDKLLKIQIKVGSELRQVVSGIAKFYTPEDLPGKQVVLVANLAPRKVFGVESQGMLLAATKGKKLRLVTVDGELNSGAKVT
jgi:methionyl-tRNA synthetase